MQSVRWILGLTLLFGCTDRGGGGDDVVQVPTGAGSTTFTNGEDPKNPFFLELGTNGRTCATCHDRTSDWSVTPAGLQARFDATDGMDPIFRPVDGATSPSADVSTLDARRTAYRELLTRGVLRVGIAIPADAEFTLSAVSDPYGFASATELSLFRRPLPSTNLRFLPQIMWDAREPTLAHQATDATMGHAQATGLGSDDAAAIVAFESSLYTAQQTDDVAGDLGANGATGGPEALSAFAFQVGMNDSLSPGFDRDVFRMFAGWANADTSTPAGQRRAAIARGEQIFNTERLQIRGAAGIPDQQGTCSTCHDTPNVGNHSQALPVNIGASDPDDDLDDLPVYTLRNKADGRTVRTSDPGYALTTGKWADIGRFEVPVLRGVAMRAPYFHNGSRDNLDDVVRFYRRRFQMRLNDNEQADLVAFLSSL